MMCTGSLANSGVVIAEAPLLCTNKVLFVFYAAENGVNRQTLAAILKKTENAEEEEGHHRFRQIHQTYRQ